MCARILSIGLFVLIAGQSAMAADYTYEGFIGATVREGNDEPNLAARIDFYDKAAAIYIAHDFPNTALYKGQLNIAVDGRLRGSLTTWEGTEIGEIDLHKRMENGLIVWEGNLSTASDVKLVRLSRSQNAPSNDIIDRSGNLITKDFARKLRYIPPELSLHAVPKFDRLPQAISVLRDNFPYFGQDYTGPYFPESKYISRRNGGPTAILMGDLKIDYAKTKITNLPAILSNCLDNSFNAYCNHCFNTLFSN